MRPTSVPSTANPGINLPLGDALTNSDDGSNDLVTGHTRETNREGLLLHKRVSEDAMDGRRS